MGTSDHYPARVMKITTRPVTPDKKMLQTKVQPDFPRTRVHEKISIKANKIKFCSRIIPGMSSRDICHAFGVPILSPLACLNLKRDCTCLGKSHACPTAEDTKLSHVLRFIGGMNLNSETRVSFTGYQFRQTPLSKACLSSFEVSS